MLGTNTFTTLRALVSTILAATISVAGLLSSAGAQEQLSLTINPANSSMRVALDGRELAVLPVKPEKLRTLVAHQHRRSDRRAMRWHDDCVDYGYYGGGYNYSGWYGYSPYGYYRRHYQRPAFAKLELKTGRELELIALSGNVDPVTTAAIGGSGKLLADRWHDTLTNQAGSDASVDIVVSRRPQIELMAEIQHGLNRLGYDSGPEDGIIGPRTQAAVKRFQQANGLDVDSKIGPATINALHAALGPKAPKPALLTARRDGRIIERFDLALVSPGDNLGTHILLRDQSGKQFMFGWRMAAVTGSAAQSNGELFGLAKGNTAGSQAWTALERLAFEPSQAALLRRLAGSGSTLVITDQAVESGGMQIAAN